MLHIKLMLALILSLACTTNVSAAGLHKTTDTTQKIKAQTQPAPPVADLPAPAVTQTQKITSQTQPILVDQIVAVVNNDAITRYELEDRLGTIERQLKKQGTALPDTAMLKKQILERMITEILLAQFARKPAYALMISSLTKPCSA